MGKKRTLATWCNEATHWERLRWGERVKTGGEGDDRGWDGWMASPTQCTWVWVNSQNWWWTGKSGMLQSMGSQRVRHDWGTEMNWTEPQSLCFPVILGQLSYIFINKIPFLPSPEWKRILYCMRIRKHRRIMNKIKSLPCHQKRLLNT